MSLQKILKELQAEEAQSVKTLEIQPRIDSQLIRRDLIRTLSKMTQVSSKGRRTFQMDVETEKAVELVAQYLNNEPEFEKDSRSLSKGLWIAGNFGSGKTQLLKAYRWIKKKRFNEVVGLQTCVDMNHAYLKKDEFANNEIARFAGLKTFANKFDKTERIFDDLGEEEATIQDYGNKVCVMAHILSERYKGFSEGCVTHISTNLSMEQIDRVYGGRIESRIHEMFNVIILGSRADSPDYRKP